MKKSAFLLIVLFLFSTISQAQLLSERTKGLVIIGGEMFTDLGADYYNQFNRERKVNALLRKLHLLGWEQPSTMA